MIPAYTGGGNAGPAIDYALMLTPSRSHEIGEKPSSVHSYGIEHGDGRDEMSKLKRENGWAKHEVRKFTYSLDEADSKIVTDDKLHAAAYDAVRGMGFTGPMVVAIHRNTPNLHAHVIVSNFAIENGRAVKWTTLEKDTQCRRVELKYGLSHSNGLAMVDGDGHVVNTPAAKLQAMRRNTKDAKKEKDDRIRAEIRTAVRASLSPDKQPRQRAAAPTINPLGVERNALAAKKHPTPEHGPIAAILRGETRYPRFDAGSDLKRERKKEKAPVIGAGRVDRGEPDRKVRRQEREMTR